jgi:zinc/manganese transport system permease protein
MRDLMELMAAPFAACAILIGIHAYLGMHVIQRKVIFVDLALAQIAALGATFSFLLGLSPHGNAGYTFSLVFAIAGAAIFAFTRMRHERIPQEAIIGIVYAVALAAAILVADRAPEGAEHIKESMVGSILWVTWPTVLKTAFIYTLIGSLHVVLRKRFLQISFNPGQAYAEGRWVRLWDFVFYVSFAFVITSSVAIAGVLLVFSFLVIPAVIATLFATRIPTRLAVGWSTGIAACLIGLVASYRFDLPSGPSVVVSLGSALVLAATLYYLRAAEHKAGAAFKLAAGVITVLFAVAGVSILFVTGERFHIEHEHDWERPDGEGLAGGEGPQDTWVRLSAGCAGDRACLAARLGEQESWPNLAAAWLTAPDVREREATIEALGALADDAALDLLAAATETEVDPLLRLEAARHIAAHGDGRGARAAVRLLGDDLPPLVRDDAHELLRSLSGEDFGYDPFAAAGGNDDALRRWSEWAAAR